MLGGGQAPEKITDGAKGIRPNGRFSDATTCSSSSTPECALRRATLSPYILLPLTPFRRFFGNLHLEQTESIPKQTGSSEGCLDATVRDPSRLEINGAENSLTRH